MSNLIYHITTPEAWEAAKQQGYYAPESLALEGFIHCCQSEQQLQGVLGRFFAGQLGLICLHISTSLLESPLQYDKATDIDDIFPHIYGVLNINAVESVTTI